MEIFDTPLAGLKIVQLKKFEDSRGFFVERFSKPKFETLNLTTQFLQDNHSRSKPGVLRGLHYQYAPDQGKLVSAIRGKIWDVAVDIRMNSPTLGKWFGIELSDENSKMLYIPAGFAHGFCVLGSEPADVVYKVTEVYSPKTEEGILWNDLDFGIEWPIENPIVSERDEKLISFESYKKNPRFL
jgi:dTDP-4-dehydrorhamnose 3,5-epimerase